MLNLILNRLPQRSSFILSNELHMFFEIITDCKDDNALSKVGSRTKALLPEAQVGTWGIGTNFDQYNSLQAAGFLLDLIDATMGRKGILIANVAHRHGDSKKWENGTPFCFFSYKDTIILSSIEGHTLSLVKRLLLVNEVSLMDIPTVLQAAVKAGEVTSEEADDIARTQFRSYQFLPRAAYWLIKNAFQLPYEAYALKDIPSASNKVWHIDNFGNVKTTLLPEEIDFQPNKEIQTKLGKLICYERLSHVPNNSPALIIGSSGIGNKRFLEIVVQGSSAAKQFNLKIGDDII
jgi:hypothetical protein